MDRGGVGEGGSWKRKGGVGGEWGRVFVDFSKMKDVYSKLLML